MPYRRSQGVQARLDAQQDTILLAAIGLLSERGYRGLSIGAVAAQAGVATGTVYKHFTGKAELVTAIFREVVRHEVDAVAAAVDRSGTATEQVSAAVETFAGRAMKNPKLAYALLAEPVDPEVDAERLIFRRAFADTFEGAVAGGVASGALPPQNPQLAAAALVGAVAEVLIGPLGGGGAGAGTVPHSDNLLPELVAFALRALGVSRADT